MRVGWASPSFPAHLPLGDDENSYAFDGYLVSLSITHWYNNLVAAGQLNWQPHSMRLDSY